MFVSDHKRTFMVNDRLSKCLSIYEQTKEGNDETNG